jgi:hypothetical protein
MSFYHDNRCCCHLPNSSLLRTCARIVTRQTGSCCLTQPRRPAPLLCHHRPCHPLPQCHAQLLSHHQSCRPPPHRWRLLHVLSLHYHKRRHLVHQRGRWWRRLLRAALLQGRMQLPPCGCPAGRFPPGLAAGTGGWTPAAGWGHRTRFLLVLWSNDYMLHSVIYTAWTYRLSESWRLGNCGRSEKLSGMSDAQSCCSSGWRGAAHCGGWSESAQEQQVCLLQQVPLPLPPLQANSRLLLLFHVNANIRDCSKGAASCHLTQRQAVGVLREAHQQPACSMTSLL